MTLRLAVVAALAVVAMAGSVSASAAPKHRGCGVGPGEGGNTTIGAWELMLETELAGAFASIGHPDAEGIAEAFFAKNDKNGDGLLCVMPQVLPNEASGDDEFFVAHDNNANASTG
jgi:hypothetical protein